MSKNNIILIGMTGSGKSTLGVVLAKKIGYSFIDSDIVIQDTYKKTLEQLIEENGDTGFIKIENDVNCLISPEHTIIATGGSAVYCEEAMLHYKETCQIVYLRCPYEILSKRLGDLKGRGVALKEGQTLLDLYEERSVLYEKYADVIIDEDNKGIEETLELLKEKFC